MTGRTVFFDGYIHSRTHTLTRDLHESELTERQDIVASTVFLHVLAHALIEQLSVFCQCHIDEIDDDDAAHISQSQLTSQLIGSTEVGLQCIGFLSVFFLNACTAVDIHHVHCFGMLDDEVGASFVVDGASEARFQLLGDVEVVEDGYIAFVELHDVSLFRSYHADIAVNLIEDLRVVDVDAVVSGVEEVAQ